MTRFILINSGEVNDKDIVAANKENKANFKCNEYNFSLLSKRGIQQAEEMSRDERLKEGRIVIHSPYSEAIQTAHIIGRNLGLPVNGEFNLYEWIYDLSKCSLNPNLFRDNFMNAKTDFLIGRSLKEIERKNYEAFINVRNRALTVLYRYLTYESVIVVSHEILIYTLSLEMLGPSKITEINHDEESISRLILKP